MRKKFHPSTSDKPLIIKIVRVQRWNGGTSNDKIYFSEKSTEKVLTTVKKPHIKGLVFIMVVGYWLLVAGSIV